MVSAVFDREAAIFSCKAIAVLGLVMVALGAPTALLLRASTGWPTLGMGVAILGGALLVLSGVAIRLLRRD